MKSINTGLLAVVLTCAACAPETTQKSSSPGRATVAAPLPSSASAQQPIGAHTQHVSTPSAPSPAAAAAGAPAVPAAAPAAAAGGPALPAASVPPKGANPEGAAPAPGKPPTTPVTPPNPANAATGGGSGADKFCDKYGMHCGYGMPNRHADRAACMADFNATPVQQGCKNMHMDTAIAGTAAACNGMPSAFCFAIHCLHAAGIKDQTGVTYCK